MNPFLQMYVAMARSRLGEDESAPEAGEKLTLNVLLTMMNGDVVHEEEVDWNGEFSPTAFDDLNICYESDLPTVNR